MRYWWVNHSQTFRQEFDGCYIWAPKRKKNGARNRFYDFLRAVRPGDLVFSYAKGAIRGLGPATSFCYSCPRPEEFGHIGEAWNEVGWRVDVRFQSFGVCPSPKDHLPLLRPLIEREKYSPLRITGDGQQHIYLTSISAPFAETLLGLLDSDIANRIKLGFFDAQDRIVETQLTGQQEWEDIEQRHILAADMAETTRTALIKARVGQGLFKKRVAERENQCRVTFVTNPAHLIGSHIKPWRECTNEERLEGANGLLLTPTIDHLFDRGFISFEDSGELLLSPVADIVSIRRMGIDPDRRPKPISLNADQRHFMNFHRKLVFLSEVE